MVALEALSFYAAFSGASAIDLRLNVSVPALSLQSPFTINFNNYLKYQTLEVIHWNVEFHRAVFPNLSSATAHTSHKTNTGAPPMESHQKTYDVMKSNDLLDLLCVRPGPL